MALSLAFLNLEVSLNRNSLKMQKQLQQVDYSGHHKVVITGSKSESNRLLILKALYPSIEISNLSNSQDTHVLQKALESSKDSIDIHHAGTAMRFLTAFYACFTKKNITLTGSQRMQERPIKVLVEALNELGCHASYLNKEGYPPLEIKPASSLNHKIQLPANISSQYTSALMLVAPRLKNGLQIELTSTITSLPYLKMTQNLMKTIGIHVDFTGNTISIKPQPKVDNISLSVESDWSSASYFYSLVALSKNLVLDLYTYKEDSLQGDSKLAALYEPLGVKTTFFDSLIRLEKIELIKRSVEEFGPYEVDLNDTPDLAQTIAVTCLGLNIPCRLTGLQTLKIKETDRLIALKTEIEKFGAQVEVDHESLKLTPTPNLNNEVRVDTYNDHRMAMAFAPLSTKVNVIINDAEVVEKSYPDFWNDLAKIS